ncbi:MAG TPA: 2OG-Fe(II) oxygenase [Longimicrobium sp.]|jgi:hypothetical protein|uniref:2OG-Fe(II) oxygenase family protein n=1 Tax=Longimicrobium sp. TaxID=2029185 RepID=UPI002EDB5C9A
MHPFEPAPLRTEPFPHVLQDGYLEPELYGALLAAFPECPPGSGPTGYNYFWGDPEYDQLLEGSEAWRTLFNRFHSQAFVDYVLGQFREVVERECVVDLSNARYVPYQESRADKEAPRIANVVHAPDELWVRMDVAQARTGYDRGAHLDHRRRVATMLLYFCDADEIEMVGGDLRLHPGPDAPATEVIRPRHNRMAMFPCHNASWHSASAITSQKGPRNFLQISLSSSIDLWKPLPVSPLTRATAGLRALAGRAASVFG